MWLYRFVLLSAMIYHALSSCENRTLGVYEKEAYGVLCCPNATVHWVNGVKTSVSAGMVFPCEPATRESVAEKATREALTLFQWFLCGFCVMQYHCKCSRMYLFVFYVSASETIPLVICVRNFKSVRDNIEYSCIRQREK